MEFDTNTNIQNIFDDAKLRRKEAGRKGHMQKRGISPLIATLILIAITIVGGVVVYRLFFSSSGAISSNVHVVIADVSLSATGGLTLTLKNDGNVAIASYKVTVTNRTGAILIDPPGWSNIGSRGCSNSKTSSSSVSVTASAPVSAGDVLVAIVATDNIATTDGDKSDISSVTDSKSNSYTKAVQFTNSEGSAGSGATVGIYFSKITTTLTTSDTVTANFASAVTAKAIAIHEYSMSTGTSITVAGTATQAGTSSTSVSMTISGLTSQEYLWIGGVAVEGPNGDTFTQYTDYTTLGPGTSSCGTSGMNAASNMVIRGGFRIFTGTSDTYDPTLGIAHDFAGGYVALGEVTTTTTTTTTTTVPGGIVPGASFVFTATFTGVKGGDTYNIRVTVTSASGSSY